jgi:hypothetical protein
MTENEQDLEILRLRERYNLVLGIAVIALVISICVVVFARWG